MANRRHQLARREEPARDPHEIHVIADVFGGPAAAVEHAEIVVWLDVGEGEVGRGLLRLVGDRIPDFLEPEAVEVLLVDRSKLGDSLLQEREGEPPVEGPSASEARGAETGPERIVKRAALGREAEELPNRMVPERLAHIDRSTGGQRSLHDRRVPQEVVEFQEDKLADADVEAGPEGFGERDGGSVPRMIFNHQWKQDVRVDGDHACPSGQLAGRVVRPRRAVTPHRPERTLSASPTAL